MRYLPVPVQVRIDFEDGCHRLHIQAKGPALTRPYGVAEYYALKKGSLIKEWLQMFMEQPHALLLLKPSFNESNTVNKQQVKPDYTPTQYLPAEAAIDYVGESIQDTVTIRIRVPKTPAGNLNRPYGAAIRVKEPRSLMDFIRVSGSENVAEITEQLAAYWKKHPHVPAEAYLRWKWDGEKMKYTPWFDAPTQAPDDQFILPDSPSIEQGPTPPYPTWDDFIPYPQTSAVIPYAIEGEHWEKNPQTGDWKFVFNEYGNSVKTSEEEQSDGTKSDSGS
jgi:hypothetical protein